MDITGWFLSQVRPSVVLETITGWVFGWFERQWPAHQWRWRMERPKTLQINVWSTIFQVWLKFQGWKVYFNSKKTQRIWNVTKTSASEMPITCNPDGVLAFRKEWGRNEMKWNEMTPLSFCQLYPGIRYQNLPSYATTFPTGRGLWRTWRRLSAKVALQILSPAGVASDR